MNTTLIKKLKGQLSKNIPDGLLSPRYLLPFQSDDVRIHRRIFWYAKHPKLPRVIWFFQQLFFWLRWVLFVGWVHTFSVVKSSNGAVTKHYGIPYWEQLRRCLWGAIYWSIPADELYMSQIIQTRAPYLGIIYSSETKGWHALQNATHPNADLSQKLLADKHAFAIAMKAKGFPVVEAYNSPTPNDMRTFSEQFGTKNAAVFCKLRQGNQALHAFAAYFDQGQLKGHLQTGKPLKTAEEVDAAWNALTAFDVPIVQPCLQNHPAIAALTASGRISNLRIITRGKSIGAATLTLYTADEDEAAYWLDIELDTGRPYLPVELYPAHHPRLGVIEKFANNAPKIIPFWDQICADSLRAHTEEFDLWAIAWDWAITPEGPMLLEGNSGWGVHDWQLQSGSLLLPYTVS